VLVGVIVTFTGVVGIAVAATGAFGSMKLLGAFVIGMFIFSFTLSMGFENPPLDEHPALMARHAINASNTITTIAFIVSSPAYHKEE
jgi:hypothetical protein